MREMHLAALSAAVTVMSAAGAWGQVTGYDAYKTNDYVQSSSAQPTTPYNYRFDARLFTQNDGDATAATLDGGTAGTANFSVSTPTFLFYRDNGYSTAAARDAAWPSGSYAYSVTAGTLAPSAGSLTVPDPVYADAVPYLTGTSYDALQGMDAAAPLGVTFNGYAPVGGHDVNSTFFSIFDNDTGALVLNLFGDTTTFQSALIPAGTLEPGKSYSYSVIFTTRINEGGTDDFAGAGATEGFDLNTSGSFTTAAIPEPARALPSLFGVVLLRRRRT